MGKPGFNHVDAQTVELVRQTQLFLVVHAAAGRLFSVAQSGIENGDADLLWSWAFLHETSNCYDCHAMVRCLIRSKTYNSSLIIRLSYMISFANGYMKLNKSK